MPTSELRPNVPKKVLILNPIENGSRFTSRNRAIEYVKAHRAVLLDGGRFLRFVEEDPRNRAAAERAAAVYDSIEHVFIREGVGGHGSEIGNLPMARPKMALREFLTKRSEFKGVRRFAGRSGPVRVISVSNQRKEGVPGNEVVNFRS